MASLIQVTICIPLNHLIKTQLYFHIEKSKCHVNSVSLQRKITQNVSKFSINPKYCREKIVQECFSSNKYLYQVHHHQIRIRKWISYHKKPLEIGIKTHQIDIFILQSSNRGKSIWQKPKQQNKNSRERKTTWNRFKMYQFSSEIVPFFPFENPLKFIIFFPSS